MLNEIFILNKSLDNCGITKPATHPWIKPLPKSEGFIVGIDKEGFPASLEYFDKVQTNDFWKIEKDFHNTFPAFKIKEPIFENDKYRSQLEKLKKENLVERVKILEEISKECTINDKFKRESLWRRIYDIPKELKTNFDLEQDNSNPFVVLINRLIGLGQYSKEQADQWLNRFISIAIAAGKSGQLNDVASILLQNCLVNQKDENLKYNTLIYLDLYDFMSFPFLVRDIKTRNWFLSILNDEPKKNMAGESGPCSLEGTKVQLEKGKFPCPNLPVIGPSYLFSQNADIPCQHRYKKASTDIFPVGKSLVKELNGAIEYITADSKKEKTWIDIPDSNISTRALFISYLINNPNSEIDNAALLGGESKENLELNFESKSKSVIAALKGLPSQKNQLVQIFAIRKVDKGRAQLLINEVITVENIIFATKEWNNAAKNYPPFYITIAPKEKKQSSMHRIPFPPFPLDLMKHLQQMWIRGGTQFAKLSSCQTKDAFDFFLKWNKEGRDISLQLLSLILQRSTQLLIGIGQAIHLGIKSEQLYQFNNKAHFAVLNTISLFAIILYKLGYLKEIFMKETAFLIGRLLSISDTLHKEYCKIVRKGQIPPQLIGNSLIQTALDNPERALAGLLERIRIYQSWANTTQGDNLGLAKWCLSQLGKISEALSEKDLPNQLADADKAKMLLGYLARSETYKRENMDDKINN